MYRKYAASKSEILIMDGNYYGKNTWEIMKHPRVSTSCTEDAFSSPQQAFLQQKNMVKEKRESRVHIVGMRSVHEVCALCCVMCVVIV